MPIHLILAPNGMFIIYLMEMGEAEFGYLGLGSLTCKEKNNGNFFENIISNMST
jgi:hypothetical protein